MDSLWLILLIALFFENKNTQMLPTNYNKYYKYGDDK